MIITADIIIIDTMSFDFKSNSENSDFKFDYKEFCFRLWEFTCFLQRNFSSVSPIKLFADLDSLWTQLYFVESFYWPFRCNFYFVCSLCFCLEFPFNSCSTFANYFCRNEQSLAAELFVQITKLNVGKIKRCFAFCFLFLFISVLLSWINSKIFLYLPFQIFHALMLPNRRQHWTWRNQRQPWISFLYSVYRSLQTASTNSENSVIVTETFSSLLASFARFKNRRSQSNCETLVDKETLPH